MTVRSGIFTNLKMSFLIKEVGHDRFKNFGKEADFYTFKK